jgi:small subunit ribosomal protein S9
MKKSSKTKYIPAIGRRKTATARVRLFEKKGPIIVNGQPIEKYFPGEVNKLYYMEPFRITNTTGKYSARIKVNGSGQKAQRGAVVHGLARALILADSGLRPILKKKGFLTRDARMKERRKAGYAHKARAKKISPKR